MSDRQLLEHADKPPVDGFVVFNRLGEWDVDDLVMLYAYHDVALPFEQSLYAGSTEAACQDAVISRRASSPLEVSEDRHTNIVLGILIFDTLGIVHRPARQFAFGHKYYAAVFGFAETVFDKLFELVKLCFKFGNDSGLCA